MGDFGASLAKIDWGLAVLAALVGVAVAAVARRFILAVAEDILRALPGLGDRLGRRAIGSAAGRSDACRDRTPHPGSAPSAIR